MNDDIRPKGTVQVKCAHPECRWEFWVDALDPRLPDGPFHCHQHDPNAPRSIEKAPS